MHTRYIPRLRAQVVRTILHGAFSFMELKKICAFPLIFDPFAINGKLRLYILITAYCSKKNMNVSLYKPSEHPPN